MRATAAAKGTKNFKYIATSFSLMMKYLLTSCILISVLMLSSGVSFENSFILSLAIFAQWIPGALLWTCVKRESRVPLTELIGMGLAIGTLLALLSSQLFRTTPLGVWGWAVPFLMSMLLIVWSSLKGSSLISFHTFNPNLKQFVRSFTPALVLGVVQLSVWWRWHPLKWSGWWKYNVDVPYFESYSNSLALLGTTHSLMDPALDSRYHWFAYAWVGSLTNTLHIESYVVLTRLLPIVAMIMGATIAYAWAQSMSRKYWTPGLAALIIVIGPGLSIGSFVMLRSPSSAMSVGWSLAFTLLLFEIINGQSKRLLAYLTLVLLSIGIVGGKATNTPLIGVAIVLLLFTSFFQNRETRNRILTSGILCLITLGITFEILIASPDSRRLNFGIYLGWPGLILTILPTTVGIFVLSRNKKSNINPLLVYVVVILIIGSLLSLFTYDPSGNQIYFLLSAATICVVPGIIGLERIFSSQQEAQIFIDTAKNVIMRKIFLGTSVIMAGTAASVIWTTFENSTSSFGKLGRTFAPFPLWLVCAIASFLLVCTFKVKVRQHRSIFDLLLMTAFAATIVSSGSSILYSVAHGPLYAGSSGIFSYGRSTQSDPGSISYNYIRAG